MFCGQCGAANPDGNKFCSSCGAPLQVSPGTAQNGASTNAADGIPKRHTRKFIILGVTVLLVAALAAFFLREKPTTPTHFDKEALCGRWYRQSLSQDFARDVFYFQSTSSLLTWTETGPFTEAKGPYVESNGTVQSNYCILASWEIVGPDTIRFMYNENETGYRNFYAGAGDVQVTYSEDGSVLTLRSDNAFSITLQRYP